MAQEYKVSAVSEQTKQWDSAYGPMVTYYVKLVGSDEAVQLNKKSDSSAPKTGEELYGSLTSTEYGPKFKSEKKPFNSTQTNTQGQQKYDPSFQANIRAQWAIGQAKDAVAIVTTADDEESYFTNVLRFALRLFKMADQVVEGSKQKDRQNVQAAFGDKVITDFNPDQPIDLNDIPF